MLDAILYNKLQAGFGKSEVGISYLFFNSKALHYYRQQNERNIDD